MIKKFTIIYIISALAILIGAGAYWYWGSRNCQLNSISQLNTNQLVNSSSINTTDVNLVNVLVDKSDENLTYLSNYGYSLTYPKYYKENKLYTVWGGEGGGAVGLLEEWGVNKGQETIFVISIYPKDKESEVLKYYGHQILDERVMIGGAAVNKLKALGVFDGFILENESYIFIIHTTFSPADMPQYQEYKDILNSIKFKLK
jgi:hypothetical protein